MKVRMNRRTMLRGVVGGTVVGLALPTLECMLNGNGTAYAAGEPLAKRFGVFFWGNGVRASQWRPAATGAAYQLSPNLMPLAEFKNQLHVISGLDIKTGNPRGHHAGTVGILSGAPLIPQPAASGSYASTFSQPSIDQVVANHFQADPLRRTAFRSVEIGVSKDVIYGEGTTLGHLSHNGPDNTNPAVRSPKTLFNRLFSADFIASAASQKPDPKLALRRQLLDAVSADARALSQKVSAADRRRLDQHLTSVAELQTRLETLETQSVRQCSPGTAPNDIPEKNGQEQLALISTAMADVLALALACDRTRVFSIMYSGSVGYTSFPEDGVTAGSHDLSHNAPGDQPQLSTGVTVTMRHFGLFLKRLKETSDGARSLLDGAAILASSDLAEGRAHTNNDYPILLVGGAGGALRSGIHYRGNGGNTSMALLTAMRAVDVPLANGFGKDGGFTTDALGDLEA